jgi:hypothetical protein
MSVKKVNRAQSTYKEANIDMYTPDFSDGIIEKVAIEQIERRKP